MHSHQNQVSFSYLHDVSIHSRLDTLQTSISFLHAYVAYRRSIYLHRHNSISTWTCISKHITHENHWFMRFFPASPRLPCRGTVRRQAPHCCALCVGAPCQGRRGRAMSTGGAEPQSRTTWGQSPGEASYGQVMDIALIFFRRKRNGIALRWVGLLSRAALCKLEEYCQIAHEYYDSRS